MKLPPRGKKVSRRESVSSLFPKSSDYSLPKEMLPSAMGDTFTDAVGERTRCHPRGVSGFGGGAKKDIVTEKE